MKGGLLMNIAIIISATGVFSGALFAYIGYSKGLKKDCKSEGKEQGEQKAELEQLKIQVKEASENKADTEYIKRRVDDILLEQRTTNTKLDNHAERITRVEESVKQAHKRIDEHIRLEKGE